MDGMDGMDAENGLQRMELMENRGNDWKNGNELERGWYIRPIEVKKAEEKGTLGVCKGQQPSPLLLVLLHAAHGRVHLFTLQEII
jgi:hypothetical protein